MILTLPRRGTLQNSAVLAGAGAVAAFALPPFHLIFLLVPTLGVLLVGVGAAGSWRGAFMAGFWFGLGHHVVGLYWITEAILIAASRFWWLVPLAVPALAAVLALFIGAACAAARLAPGGWRRGCALAGAWTLADLARQFVLTGFPWNPLGSVWAVPGWFGDVMIQPAALVGVHGLTLATVLVATALTAGKRLTQLATVLLLAWFGYGLWRTEQPQPAAPGPVLVLTQGNVTQGMKWDRAAALGTFRHYLELTRTGADAARSRYPGQRIAVIWPETASPFLLDSDANARAAIAEAAGTDTVVLAGSVRFDSEQQPRNSLLVVDGAAAPLAVYDKWHLVPFGEYPPSWMPLPIQVVPGRGFAFGPGPRTLAIPGLPPAGPLICYEAIFPGQVVDPTDRPRWMVNVTNDAWFGNSTGPRQHLAAARFRAVEEGMPLARAANTGISAVFDARGHEIDRIGMNQTGFLVVPLPPLHPLTPVGSKRLWIPAMFAGIALVFGLSRGQGGINPGVKTLRNS